MYVAGNDNRWWWDKVVCGSIHFHLKISRSEVDYMKFNYFYNNEKREEEKEGEKKGAQLHHIKKKGKRK